MEQLLGVHGQRGRLHPLPVEHPRHAAGGPQLAAFIHIPLLARSGAVRRKGAPRVTLEELVDAGEAMLMEMVGLARKRRNTPAPTAPALG